TDTDAMIEDQVRALFDTGTDVRAVAGAADRVLQTRALVQSGEVAGLHQDRLGDLELLGRVGVAVIEMGTRRDARDLRGQLRVQRLAVRLASGPSLLAFL